MVAFRLNGVLESFRVTGVESPGLVSGIPDRKSPADLQKENDERSGIRVFFQDGFDCADDLRHLARVERIGMRGGKLPGVVVEVLAGG